MSFIIIVRKFASTANTISILVEQAELPNCCNAVCYMEVHVDSGLGLIRVAKLCVWKFFEQRV